MENSAKKVYPQKDYSKVVDLQIGKVPPSSVELEEAVIAAMMIDAAGIDECLMVLKNPDVFYKEAHKNIFEAIQALHRESAMVDLLTVSNQMRKMGTLAESGGDYYLMQLTQKISSSAHIEIHSRLLLQFWIKRQMIRDSSEILTKAYDEEMDVFDLMALASNKIDMVNEQTSSGITDLTMKAGLNKIEKRIEVLSSAKDDALSGCFTGFKKLDKLTNGWQPTDLIVIGARPGMGKTSLVLKTMLENVKRDVPVGFISCEMSTQQLMTRMIACNSHFHLNQLFRTGFEKTKYFLQFRELKEQMETYPAYFDDTSIDVYDVVSKLRLWKRKYGIKMAIIDYLQLMSCKSLGKNTIREQEISTITRTLKRVAKELKLPIILLSQLGRDVETRGDKRPQLKDLRESGAIEQDADVVAFIYRPSYYGLEADLDMESQGANTEFIIAKHRNGSLDRKGLYFDENKTKFMDPEDLEASNQHDNEMNEAAGLPKINPSDAFETNEVGNKNHFI
jgi:replicative DNA helicase